MTTAQAPASGRTTPAGNMDASREIAHETSSYAPEADYSKYTNRSYPWAPRVTPFDRIVEHDYEGKGTEESPYWISWLPEDPENPLTFSRGHKWGLTMFVSIATLAVSLASSAYSGATTSIAQELGGSSILITLGVSFFVLGFALGPLIWAPFSEMFGRRNLFIGTYLFFTIFNAVGAASQTLAQLLVFRFFAGAFGSSPLTNAGGTLADVFNSKDRGVAMSLFALAPFLGPALGPITGGFLGESAGFRWVQGFLAIFSGVVGIAGVFLYTETYAPLLLQRRAKKLNKATGKVYRPDFERGKKQKSVAQLFKTAMGRPWLLLIYEPIVMLLSLYTAIVYAILYSFFSAFPIVFQQVRGWSPGIGGLSFLGILVGMLIAIAVYIWYFNPDYVKIVDKHGGVTAPPEARLKPSLLGAPLLVVGLAAFAATDFPSIHWIVPIICSSPFGFAMVLVFLSLQTYLVDAYLIYAASVLAANSVIRSLLGAVFPIITPYMYNPGGPNGGCPTETCGIHVGPAIAGGLALIFMPAPFLFYKYGASIRAKCKYAAEANQLVERMLQAGKTQEPPSDAPSSDQGDVEKQPTRTSDEEPTEVMAPSRAATVSAADKQQRSDGQQQGGSRQQQQRPGNKTHDTTPQYQGQKDQDLELQPHFSLP